MITVAVLATVFLTRFVWVFPATYLARLVPRVRRRDPAPPPKFPTVIGWAGMRGVVTLATALALPLTLAGDAPYPRALFIWLAFAVIVVTLVGPGRHPAGGRPAAASCRPTTRCRTRSPRPRVQQQASRAARDASTSWPTSAPAAVVERLRELVEDRTNLAWERLGGAERGNPVAGVRSAAAGDDRRRAGGVPGGPGRRAGSRRRCWCGPIVTWTWRSRCWTGRVEE